MSKIGVKKFLKSHLNSHQDKLEDMNEQPGHKGFLEHLSRVRESKQKSVTYVNRPHYQS